MKKLDCGCFEDEHGKIWALKSCTKLHASSSSYETELVIVNMSGDIDLTKLSKSMLDHIKQVTMDALLHGADPMAGTPKGIMQWKEWKPVKDKSTNDCMSIDLPLIDWDAEDFDDIKYSAMLNSYHVYSMLNGQQIKSKLRTDLPPCTFDHPTWRSDLQWEMHQHFGDTVPLTEEYDG